MDPAVALRRAADRRTRQGQPGGPSYEAGALSRDRGLREAPRGASGTVSYVPSEGHHLPPRPPEGTGRVRRALTLART